MVIIDYDKELTEEQYATEEYQVGRANGISVALGIMQRYKSRGYTLDQIIELTFAAYNNSNQSDERKSLIQTYLVTSDQVTNEVEDLLSKIGKTELISATLCLYLVKTDAKIEVIQAAKHVLDVRKETEGELYGK